MRRARRRGDPEFLRARAYLADPTLGGPDLESRFHDATFAPWLTRVGAVLIRPTPTTRFWSVWRGAWFLGIGITPHAAISRARRYRTHWIIARPHHPTRRQLPNCALDMPRTSPPPAGPPQPRLTPAHTRP